MKVLLTFFAVLVLCGCFNEEEDRKDRAKIFETANVWLLENKLEGTVTCNYLSPYYCDVITKDPRPPITLFCTEVCRISE